MCKTWEKLDHSLDKNVLLTEDTEIPYFAILCYCYFCCRIRGKTTLILEVSKGGNLVKQFFMEVLDVS